MQNCDTAHPIITMNKLFESMPVAMALIDREGRHVAVNAELATISGMPADALVGRKVAEMSPESGDNIVRDFKMFDAGMDVPKHELRIRDRMFLVSVRPVRDDGGTAVAELVVLADITQQKRLELELLEANRMLEYLACRDPLTNLLNARTFNEVCSQMIMVAKRKQKPFSVLFLDLDHFKVVNDTFGHDAGDAVLAATAACIADRCRGSDIIGRLGGEEFGVFLPDTDPRGAHVLAEKLRACIEQLKPQHLAHEIEVTVSIGLATSAGGYPAIGGILREADHALYQAKQAGRNRVMPPVE